MDYVNLGASGLEVSRLALGCMSFGDPEWRPWVLDEERAGPIVKAAIEAGINFFDTADMYSLGRSEEITGKWLAEYGNRDEVVIASKVCFPMAEGPNRRGLSRKHIQQSCEASLRRLGTDVIDLYQIHRLDGATPAEEILEALDDLVRSGKVRYLGASTMFAWELSELMGLAEHQGWARFVSMQNHYNLIYREEEREMIPLCRHRGVGLIPYSPLARGVLTGSRTAVGAGSTTRSTTDALDHKLYSAADDFDIVAAVRRVAEHHGRPMAQIALAWVRSRPGVVAPIVGVTRPEQLRDALDSLTIELDEADVAELEAGYTPRPVVDPAGPLLVRATPGAGVSPGWRAPRTTAPPAR